MLFLAVGAGLFVLAYAAGEAADRRGDARVLLISLAFLATGGFLGLHALGTPASCSRDEHAGFKVAIPVGLLVLAALFAVASAFVDVRPDVRAAGVVRHRVALRRAVLGAMAVWFAWTVAELPPLRRAQQRGRRRTACWPRSPASARSSTRVAAVRYWFVYRDRLEPAAGQRDRLLRPARRGDDRRRAHRRARLARELVGVARADRRRLPRGRLRRPPRVARRALPRRSTSPPRASAARRSACCSATSPASRRSPSARRRPRSRPCSTPTTRSRRR